MTDSPPNTTDTADESADYTDLPITGGIGPEDHTAVCSFLSALAEEGRDKRQEWVAMADSCNTIYLWGEDPEPFDTKVVVNEIQNAVVAATDIQTKEPPAVTLEPVETGEPGECFWTGTPEEGAMLGSLGMDPMTGQPMADPMTGQPVGPQPIALRPEQLSAWPDPITGEMRPPLPLSKREAEAVKELILQGVIPEKMLVEVDDALVSECYQSVFDVYAMRSQMDLWNRQNVLNNNIHGWALGLYEWDDDRGRHELKHLSVKQVYLDDTVADISAMCYVMVDLSVDHRQALKLWPHLADALKQHAHTGQPEGIDSWTDYGGEWQGRDFKRKYNELRIAWLRNQPCPYSEEQAVEMGLVVQEVLPDVVQMEDGAAGAAGSDGGAGDGGDGGGILPDGVPQAGGSVGAMGAGVSGAPAAPSYTLAATGEETAPGAQNWPTYPCLRQITAIAGVIIDDRECEHWDIPILHNVNIPIPHRPWGIGEPYRLRNLQAAHSRAVNSMVAHADYFKAPLVTMSKSMAQALTETYGDAYIKPGRTIIVDDDIWMMTGGKIDNIVQAPPISPALVELQTMLKQMITENSGHAEVLQGRAQSNVKSGKMLDSLQEAATSMIGFKSQRTGDMVWRQGMLMLHSLVWRLEAEDIGKIVSKYQPHILAAIHQRARQMEWDMKVTVSSGNGALLAKKKAEAAELFQIRDPVTGEGAITLETLREYAGIDHRQEEQRQEAAAQRMLRKQGQMQQQAAGQSGGNTPGGENGKKKEPANGNGNGRHF